MPKSTCGGCGVVFTGMTAFDIHRTGKYCLPVIEHGEVVRYTSNLRRCITEDAMIKRGLIKNSKGIWTTPIDASKIWYATKNIEKSEDINEIA